jgi:hypothetical protein
VQDSESSERTEKGSDELLYELTDDHKVMLPVYKDDELRAKEEARVRIMPTDGNLG